MIHTLYDVAHAYLSNLIFFVPINQPPFHSSDIPRHAALAIKFHDLYSGNLESMYHLFEASITLGTSVTTISRVYAVDVVLNYPDLPFKTEAQPLPVAGNVGS